MKLLCALCILGGTAASAGPVMFDSLTFDGLLDGEQVLQYYNGGTGGEGSGPGPNFGVSFTDGLAADSTVIAFGPSAILTAPTVTMNLEDPWSGVISFYFVGTGTVSFYSEQNAGGTLVGSYPLLYPPFFPFGAAPGTFQSVVFDSATGLRLDSITFGAEVIPEPYSLTLLSLGIVSLAGFRRLCFRRQR